MIRLSRNYSTTLLALLMLTLFSCAKGEGQGQDPECGIMPADKVLHIKIGSMDKTANLWKNDGRSNDNDYCIIDAQTTSSNAELIAALEVFDLNSKINISPSAVIGISYFVDKNLSDQMNYAMAKADLKAFIIYYETGKFLGVKVFEQDHGAFKEISELASETDNISSNNAEKLSEIYFNKGIPAISSILLADNSKLENRAAGRDQFSGKLEQYSKQAQLQNQQDL